MTLLILHREPARKSAALEQDCILTHRLRNTSHMLAFRTANPPDDIQMQHKQHR